METKKRQPFRGKIKGIDPPKDLPKLIIGLTGRKGAGKTTIAKKLQQACDFKIMSMAAPLKEACSALWSLDKEHFTNPDLKDKKIEYWGMSPREMMQKLGTDFIRDHVHPDTLAMSARRKIEAGFTSNFNLVFDDIRFDNEAEMLQSFPYYIIMEVKSEDEQANPDPHRSEAGIDPKYIDTTVYNTWKSGYELEVFVKRILYDYVSDKLEKTYRVTNQDQENALRLNPAVRYLWGEESGDSD